jgi:hypothetical protein
MCFQNKILHYSDYPFGIFLGPIIIYILLHVCESHNMSPGTQVSSTNINDRHDISNPSREEQKFDSSKI